MWPMPNVLVALPNIGGALCSTPQSLADAHTRVLCSNAAKPRNPLKLDGVSQTNETISAASGRSPYCKDIWGRYCCLTSFFRLSIRCLNCKDIARQNCAMVPRWRFLATFLHPVFSASSVQQVSDLHLKFALRPHHVWKYGRHPICGG